MEHDYIIVNRDFLETMTGPVSVFGEVFKRAREKQACICSFYKGKWTITFAPQNPVLPPVYTLVK